MTYKQDFKNKKVEKHQKIGEIYYADSNKGIPKPQGEDTDPNRTGEGFSIF